MRRILAYCLVSILFYVQVGASEYSGRVVDSQGNAIGYATVYPEANPVEGTATNNDGYFTFSTALPTGSWVVISFIGYEKQLLPLSSLTPDKKARIVLKEQPIALEETVVEAQPSKQRNKRKKMARLLYQVLTQMQRDFSSEPVRYQVVSDVRMDAESQPWGMEQMIASAVVLPDARRDNTDSVQFSGEYCKRFFKPEIRALADTIYKGQTMERIDKRMRRAAVAVDSGVVVHQELFRAGNICDDFQKNSNDLSHWRVTQEGENETVLTHTEKRNYGIYSYLIYRHYIIHSQTYQIQRFSEQATIKLSIPFGKKLNADYLQILNLLNMNEQMIERFRLRRAEAQVSLNTIYQRRKGHLYIQEKNMHVDGRIQDMKGVVIPLTINASQRVVRLQTQNVQAMSPSQIQRRVKREIVEIY